MNFHKKPLAVVLGSAFAVSLAAAPIVHAEQNPFALKALSSGYMVAEADANAPADTSAADDGKMKDGKCSTGKCSSSMKKKKAKAKSEADAKAKEGNCSGEKKSKEGNCSANK